MGAVVLSHGTTLKHAEESKSICAVRLRHTRLRSPIMPGLTAAPPFPDDVPTHPLLVIDYQLILEGDEDELNRLWEAATELGFW